MRGYLFLLFSLLAVNGRTQSLVYRFAGNCMSISTGDGGPATNAQIFGAHGICVDSAGNLYIAEENRRIRKINTSGIITTITGPVPGFGGDGGPASAASVLPYGVDCDAAGNLLIGDWSNNRIRKIDAATGIITTVAGNGIAGSLGDGGPATNAQLNRPTDAVFDAHSNIIISEYSGNRLRKVDAISGIITTIAGTGGGGYTGDGGPATSARISGPNQIAIDGKNIYVVCKTGRVRKIDSMGIITTVAGGGSLDTVSGFPATDADLWGPQGLAIDCDHNIYIADNDHHLVRKVYATTGFITTIAGGGTDTTSTVGVPVLDAKFHNERLCFDRFGNLYISNDEGCFSIYQIPHMATPCPVHIPDDGNVLSQQFNYKQTNPHIFPNPAQNVLNIEGCTGNYRLINLTGNTILAGSVSNITTVSMAGIPPGIYILEVTLSGGERNITRLVKQ